MRPIRLYLENFGSFREPVEVDFADVDYFALVGATGSGKSTVIDAICFALYGTVPRWGKENVVAYALAPSATSGRVALVFEVSGRRHGVVRTLLRDAKNSVRTKEARLDELDPGVPPTSPMTDLLAKVTNAVAEGEHVTTEVQRITGLEYKFFTQCVVLPQGRFAEFLHAQPRDRQDLLVQLLDAEVYERIRQRAVREEDTAKQHATFARNELNRLSGADEPAERAATERLAALKELASRVGDDLLALTAHDETVRRLQEEQRAAAGALAALTRLTMPGDVPGLAEGLRSAEEAVGAASTTVTTLEEAEQLADRRLADLGDRSALGERGSLLEQYLRVAGQAVQARAEADQATSALPALVERTAAAERALTDAERERDRLRTAHAGAEVAHSIVVGAPCPACLRPVTELPHHPALAGLSTAEGAVRSARKHAEDARTHHGRATAEADLLTRHASKLTTELSDLSRKVAIKAHEPVPADQPLSAGGPLPGDEPLSAGGRTPGDQPLSAGGRTPGDEPLSAGGPLPGDEPLSAGGLRSGDEPLPAGRPSPGDGPMGAGRATPGDAAGRPLPGDGPMGVGRAKLGDAAARAGEAARIGEMARVELVEITRKLQAFDEAGRQVAAARQRTRQGRAALAAAERAAAGLRGRVEQAWRELEAARDTVAGFRPPPVERADIHQGWAALLAWRDQAAETEREAGRARGERLAEALRVRDGERAELVARLGEHELVVPPDFTPMRIGQALATTVAQAESRLERIREARERARQLAQEVADRDEEARVAHELSLLLRANQFERWLCAEALELLIAAASDTLRDLSDGQYELVLGGKGEIEVVDYAEAGLRRNARTLSGGETFQAALALALALSDQVAGLAASAARSLDSIFLDEGFGTLDPATLDTVATTLERLASSHERMIGVVTHVPALADRVPTRYEITRDQTGSHVQRTTR
ncbi:SMC family ATPase [Acrocarpospora sp. B8E8]|uniref:SMC family ATPase n=1 Tax=Acrocarpospora sp. B8E8 TaxID=3153572 RepID=UPI00325EB4A5